MNGPFRMTLDDVAELMGGHYPPTDPQQRDGYWQVFLDRAMKTLTDRQFNDCVLLAGGFPDEFNDWQQERRRAERRPA